jgi:hypothetical protein
MVSVRLRIICDRIAYQQAFWRRCEFSNNVRNANKLSGAVAGDINLVATLVSVNKLSGAIAGER